VKCGTGAICLGFDAAPEAAPGYMLYQVHTDRLDIFSCSENDRCPGGGVGVCAEGRHRISCSECLPGRTPGKNGTCEICSGADSVTSVVALVACLILAAFVYYRSKGHDTIRLRHEAVLAMATITQILLVLQLSSVLARLSIYWPEPLRSLLDFLLVFTFDLDLLRVGCVQSLSEFDKYLGKLAIIPVAIFALCLCHVISSLFHREERSVSRMRLAGAVGIFLSALYISLTNVIAAPLQCASNPNGRWTMVSAEAVLCWEGGDHAVMLAIGCVFLSIPLSFFAWMIYLMKEFPLRMAWGDVTFLNSFSFLFFRVRPEARWFMIFFMARNGLVALIPTLPNAFWQCFTLVVIFGISAGVALYVLPWKLHTGNIFDIGTSCIFLALGCLALPFVSESDTEAVPEVALGLIILSLCLTPVTIFQWLLGRATQKGKAFRWFLCHHKLSGGSFARLLKLALTDSYQASVFLDSDDLVDLNHLFMYVKNDTQTLVVLCTKEILRSPWCIGEVSVANLSNIEILTLLWPDFTGVQDEFLHKVDSHLQLENLTATGLSVEDIKNGLRRLQNPVMSIDFPEFLTEASLLELVKRMNNSPTSSSAEATIRARNSSDAGTDAIIVDLRSTEAISAGLLLLKLLRPFYVGSSSTLIVAGLETFAAGGQLFRLPKTVAVAILLCTAGCFSSRVFLQALVEVALQQVAHVLPAVANKDFSFPGVAFYVDLETEVRRLCVAAGVQPDGSLLTPFVKQIFEKIFTHFFVLDSMTILNTQVKIMSKRLEQLEQSQADIVLERKEDKLEKLRQINEHAFEDTEVPAETKIEATVDDEFLPNVTTRSSL